MRRFSFFLIALAFIALGCSGEDNLLGPSEHLVAVKIQFVTPPTDEIAEVNKLGVSFENTETGRLYSWTFELPEPFVTPDKTFYVFRETVELPTGDISESIVYRMNATFLGFPSEVNNEAPSPDVTHLVIINNSTLYLGDDNGMYFTLVCSGEINPSVSLSGDRLLGFRPRIDVAPSYFYQFAEGGTIAVSVEELKVDLNSQPIWQPVLVRYDWFSGGGILPTFRFSKKIRPYISWSTSAELKPSQTDRFVRVKATYENWGMVQNVTDQLVINVDGWFQSGELEDGYRIYRIPGSSGGVGKG